MFYIVIHSFIRAIFIAIPVVTIGYFLRNSLLCSSRKWRLVFWCLLLPLFIIPTLVIGYAYSVFSFKLLDYPVASQILYMTLVIFNLLPLGFLVFHYIPRDFSPEAVHCFFLLRTTSYPGFNSGSCCLFFIRYLGKPVAASFGVVLLMAFGEFEIASLLNIRHWTVSLFDAHTQGLPVSDSISQIIMPLSFKFVVLIGIIILISKSFRSRQSSANLSEISSPFFARIGWIILFIAFTVIIIFPLFNLLYGSIDGLAILCREFWMYREILASLVLALATGIWVFGTSMLLRHHLIRLKFNSWGPWILVLIMIPGLLGSLPVALLVLAFFQFPLINTLYQTPVPVVAGLTLIILPYALILQYFFQQVKPEVSLFMTKLLQPLPSAAKMVRKIRWQLDLIRQYWLFFLVFLWAFFDLTVTAVLAPPGMTTVQVRLYNLMHYGQSEKLTATVCLVFFIPIIFLGIGGYLLKNFFPYSKHE